MANVKAVLDTNVIVSGLIFGGEPAKLLEFARKNKFKAVISLYILRELRNVLENKCKIPSQLVNELVEELTNFCEVAPVIKSSVNWTSNIKDNPIIETAIDSRTSYIVTGDKRLVFLESSLKILTVKEFLDKL